MTGVKKGRDLDAQDVLGQPWQIPYKLLQLLPLMGISKNTRRSIVIRTPDKLPPQFWGTDVFPLTLYEENLFSEKLCCHHSSITTNIIVICTNAITITNTITMTVDDYYFLLLLLSLLLLLLSLSCSSKLLSCASQILSLGPHT